MILSQETCHKEEHVILREIGWCCDHKISIYMVLFWFAISASSIVEDVF